MRQIRDRYKAPGNEYILDLEQAADEVRRFTAAPLIGIAIAFARLIDQHYVVYDDATSRLLVALADWVKHNGGEI